MKWLRKWKTEYGLCPSLEILGVLANKVRMKTRLVAVEQKILANLPKHCLESWTAHVPIFSQSIWQSQALSDNAFYRKLYAKDDLQAVFADVLLEIERKVPTYARV